jgi:nucleoside 2-deoxyribosyltransferase
MTEQKTIYIAGPMRGIKDFNFPAFDQEAAYWREHGWRVVNPAEMDREHDGPEAHANAKWSFEVYMRRDLKAIIEQCDAIVLLPGWSRSLGANIELTVARALGLRVYSSYTGEREGYWPQPFGGGGPLFPFPEQ